ncbi:MAG: hypothetical protein WD021_02670 [Rhodothermales bacterium]
MNIDYWIPRSTPPAALLLAALFIAGCGNSGSELDAAQAESIADASYLTAPLWNDGQAEMAFYRVHRTRNQYGEPDDQEFLVGTYLVKHDYDPSTEAKAAPEARDAVSAFKYALFYEFESGSYEYKRNYVINARQSDLRLLKASFTSFDWCSNLYREQAVAPSGAVHYLMRSDDYGNRRDTYAYENGSYPPSFLPVLVRAMAFEGAARLEFGVLLETGEVVGAVAERTGVETIETEAGLHEAERITVSFDGDVPSPYAEEADAVETYWRGTGEERLLLAVEGTSGRYRMELVEAVRSAYWSENVYDRLERVTMRP